MVKGYACTFKGICIRYVENCREHIMGTGGGGGGVGGSGTQSPTYKIMYAKANTAIDLP